MASSETLWHLEKQRSQTALEKLPVADISKRPESIASALQQNQKANKLAWKIVGTERAEQIQQDNPHTKHPDSLSKDPEIAHYQWMLYENLGIDKNTNTNNIIKKFSKWMIDGLFIWNAEIIMMINNEGIEKFVNAIKTQFSTLVGIGQILKALWMSLWDLATGDAYERWKSLAELGLITTGAGAVWSLAKYAGKTAIKTSVKIGGETVLRNTASQTLHAVGRTAEVFGTWLQLPAKWVKKVAEWTAKAVGAVSEKTWVSSVLRTGARIGNEVFEWTGAKKIVDKTKQIVKTSLDIGLKAVGVTQIVQAIKGKLENILDKTAKRAEEKLKVQEKYTPDILSKFDDLERLTAASELIWRSLTQEEKTAILKAHNLWEWWIGNYSFPDMRSKVDILKQAWFNPEERRILMEKWVCWIDKAISLYAHPKYRFLEKYKDVLWENITLNDIVWEWQNAVIVRYEKDPLYVVKVAMDKIWVDNLTLEFANHKVFYAKYLEWLIATKISDKVKIPEVKDLEVNWAFLIEKIEWETLYSTSVRKVLWQNGIQLEKWLTDKAIDNLVDTKYAHMQSKINSQAQKDLSAALWLKEFDDIMWIWFYLKKDIDSPVLNTLRYIMENTPNWIIHNDLHSWNIMINGDNKYVIDFWRTKETKIIPKK